MLLIVIFILAVGQSQRVELRLYPDRGDCETVKRALEMGSPPVHGLGQRFECVDP